MNNGTQSIPEVPSYFTFSFDNSVIEWLKSRDMKMREMNKSHKHSIFILYYIYNIFIFYIFFLTERSRSGE